MCHTDIRAAHYPGSGRHLLRPSPLESRTDVDLHDLPFVEAPAYVGGFWVIEAPDEAAAIDWATQASRAVQTPIEVRALQEPPEL